MLLPTKGLLDMRCSAAAGRGVASAPGGEPTELGILGGIKEEVSALPISKVGVAGGRFALFVGRDFRRVDGSEIPGSSNNFVVCKSELDAPLPATSASRSTSTISVSVASDKTTCNVDNEGVCCATERQKDFYARKVSKNSSYIRQVAAHT